MKSLCKQVFLLAFLWIAMSGCEKTEEPNPPALKPAEEQVKEIVDVLGKNPEISDFASILSKLDMSDVDAEELTVFAVKNTGSKSKSETKADLDATSIKRHIVKGVYKISDLKDGLELVSISKESLFISVKGEEVLINQVPIQTKGEVVGKSIVYIVPEMIPQYEDVPALPEKKQTVIFTVLDCNSEWSVDKTAEGIPTAGASVKIYTKNGPLYNMWEEHTTADNGQILIELPGTEEFYYTVEKADATPFMDGYKIAGLCITQGDLDILVNGRKPELGGLRFLDVNGDAQINAEDKFESVYQPVYFPENESMSHVVVFIAPPSFSYLKDALGTDLKNLENMLLSFQACYRELDADLSKEWDGFDYNNSAVLETMSERFWSSAYGLINEILRMDEKYSSDACPQALRDQWTSESPKCWLVQAFAYSKLLSYFGGVPILQRAYDLNGRASEQEVSGYVLERLKYVQNRGTMELMNSSMMLSARLLIDQGRYEEARMIADRIIHSGQYALSVADVFGSSSNKEVIWGGFADESRLKKGSYSHILRYMETLLLYSESSLEIGRVYEAIEVVNQIYALKHKEPLTPNLSQDELRLIIRGLWDSELKREGVRFANLKRWGTFLNELRPIGAREHNKHLPIARSIMDTNPYLRQSPGY